MACRRSLPPNSRSRTACSPHAGHLSPAEDKAPQGSLPAQMARVLHVLPHPGGGGERVVARLEEIGGGLEHRRAYIADTRSPLGAAPAIVTGRRRLLREARAADVVHVIGDTGALLAPPLLRERPSVFGTHGLHLMRRVRGPLARAARARMRGVLGAATVVVCTSEPELRELRELQPSARFEVVLNGIP